MLDPLSVFIGAAGGFTAGMLVMGVFAGSRVGDLLSDRDRASDVAGTLRKRLDDLADYLRGQKSGTAVKALRMIEGRGE